MSKLVAALGLITCLVAACKTMEPCEPGSILITVQCPQQSPAPKTFQVHYTKFGAAEQLIDSVPAVCPSTKIKINVTDYATLAASGEGASIDFRIVAIDANGLPIETRMIRADLQGSCVVVGDKPPGAGGNGGQGAGGLGGQNVDAGLDNGPPPPPTCGVAFKHCSTNDSEFCETDISTPENCGGCGIVCPSDKPKCSSKAGSYSCTSGCEGTSPDTCGGKCVDLRSDVQACGSCGKSCTFPNAETTCEAGECKMGACAPRYADCTSAPGCETALGTGAHCGSCNDSCTFAGATSSCVSGKCSDPVCTSGSANCDKAKPDCETDLGSAVNCTGCNMGCSAELPICASSNGSFSCVSNCTSAAPDKCTGQCVNTKTDMNNCGKCGEKCAFPGASASCVDGKCVQGQCTNGFADCTSAPGCETSLGTDSNCAGCGDVCPVNNGASSCNGSTCSAVVCNPGWTNCNSSRDCETKLGTASDCFGCGKTCSEPKPVCGGSGSTFMCVSDCTSSAPDKCGTQCVNKKTDPNNCGDQCVRCSYQDADAYCDDGVCKMGSCRGGFKSCNGACISTSLCCGCNGPCDVCSGGTCGKVAFDTTTNCGSCGNACSSGGSCVTGKCQYTVTLPVDQTTSGTARSNTTVQVNGFYTGEGDAAGTIGQRTFLKFDLAGKIPSNATIQRATLTVSMSLCQRDGAGTAIGSNFPTELGAVIVERFRFGTMDISDYTSGATSAGQVTILDNNAIGSHTADLVTAWVAADLSLGTVEIRLRHRLADTLMSNNLRDLCGFNGPKPTLDVTYTP